MEEVSSAWPPETWLDGAVPETDAGRSSFAMSSRERILVIFPVLFQLVELIFFRFRLLFFPVYKHSPGAPWGDIAHRHLIGVAAADNFRHFWRREAPLADCRNMVGLDTLVIDKLLPAGIGAERLVVERYAVSVDFCGVNFHIAGRDKQVPQIIGRTIFAYPC